MRRSWLLWCLSFAPVLAGAQSLPSLPEAFGPGRPGVDVVAPGRDLMRVDLPQARYPDARCADGSPVPMFVRRASAASHRDDWIIYLQGGGSCGSGQQCLARWQGRDGNFGANKLSSHFAPERGMRGDGIFSREARNPFAQWNQVFVYYCSSDGWSGQVSGRAAQALLQDGRTLDYRIDFLGARNVDAVFDLLHGATAVSYRDADGTSLTLPALGEARRLVFAGSSAGGGGVLRNADRVRDELHRRRGCSTQDASCGPAFAAVVDGTLGLERAGLDHSRTTLCGALAPCTYEDAMQRRWDTVVRGFWDGLTDAGCLASQAEGEAWRCADGEVLAAHHVTSPLFVRSDLQDSLVMGNTLEAGFLLDGEPLDRVRYGQALELQLLALAADTARSAPAPRPIGVFAPQCGQHVGLDQDRASFGHVVADLDGRPRTLLDALAGWLRGESVTAVQRFDAQGYPAACGRAD
jgi:hypothetical protein